MEEYEINYEVVYCLTGAYGNETMCDGDSGGPAFWEDTKDGNRAYLIGIGSSSNHGDRELACGEAPFKPGIFSRVNTDTTLNWLLSNAGKDLKKCLLEE